MSALLQFEPTRLWIEIGPDALSARQAERGQSMALERHENGEFTASCIAEVTSTLKGLLREKSPLSPLQIYASIPARGVILRRVLLPKSAATEWSRLLALQLEAEFPLPPEQLAWGWLPIPGASAAQQHPILLAVVRQETLRPYQDLLAPLGGEVRFSLAALDRLELIGHEEASAVLIHLNKTDIEIGVRLDGQPTAIRWLPSANQEVTQDLYDFLERMELPAGTGVYVLQSTASHGANPGIPEWITKAIPSAMGCPAFTVLESPTGTGMTAANAGLAKALSGNPKSHRLTLQRGSLDKPPDRWSHYPWKRLSLIAGLLATIFLTTYLEAVLLAPRLERQLARIKADEPRLAIIDRELNFLLHLQENQGPFLDAIYVIAASSPPGIHVNNLNLNRRGEVSLNGSLQNMNQVGELRAKLIDSGFFSTVVVEDQTPSPDRQRVNFRLTAQWKAASDREGLEIGPKLTNDVSPPVAPNPTPGGTPAIQTSPSP